MNSDAPQERPYKAKTVTAGGMLLAAFATRLWGAPAALTCTTDAAFVEVVRQDTDIIIFLQQVGMNKTQPQTMPIQDANVIPWNGFGRYEWSYLDFAFNNQNYSLVSSFDTSQPESKWIAELHIGNDIHSCKETYEHDPFENFIGFKFDVGQCWNLEKQQWSMNCH